MGGDARAREVVPLRLHLAVVPPPNFVVLQALRGAQAFVVGGIAYIAEQGSKEANVSEALRVLAL